VTNVVEVNPVNTVDNTVTSVDSDSKDMDESTSGATSFGTSGAPAHRDEYEWEHLSEPPDAGEIDQRNSDSSDFEETYIKRKTRRKDKKVIFTVVCVERPRAGSGVVRIDSFHFLAGCHTRRLNQALSPLS